MTRSRLTLAFRTMVGPWAMIPAAGLVIANLLQRGMPWRGEGVWTVEWLSIVLAVLGPLVAGVAAVDASRLTAPGAVHLVSVSAHPRRAFVRAAAWVWLPVVAIHLVAFAAAFGLGGIINPVIGWPRIILGVAVQCAAIAWFAALGSGLGRLCSPIVAGIVGATAGFLAVYVLGPITGEQFGLLSFGSSTVTRIGLQWSVIYQAVQLGVLAGSAVLLLSIRPRLVAAWRVPDGRGIAAASVAILAIMAAQIFGPTSTYVTTPMSPPTACYDLPTTTICFHSEHRRFALPLVLELDALFAAATSAGYDGLVPKRVEQRSWTYQPDVSTETWALWLPAEVFASQPLSRRDLLFDLLSPDHCPELSADVPPSEEYFQRYSTVVATWLSLTGVSRAEIDEDMFLGTDIPDPYPGPDEIADIISDFTACDLLGTR